MTKLFIWDFHGTLECGNDGIVKEITNNVLEKENFKRRISLQEAEMLSGKRWHEYFSFLLPELSMEQCLDLQAKCVAISQTNSSFIYNHIKPAPYAYEVLEAIANSHHVQIVLSNTQPRSLDVFLQAVKIEHFFPSSHRIGVDTHLQAKLTKKEWLLNFLKGKDFPAGIVSIGDSPGDVELANFHPAGVGYLYSHPGRPHRNANCRHKINDLRIVLQELVV
jgi:phosphoglycolate phosphatase-like HAD superfamily hydrolase